MNSSSINNIGLSTEEVAKINTIFSRYPHIDEVILYGSRARATHRPESDIDLTLVGKSLTSSQLYEIEQEIDDLMFPYMVDISIFDALTNQDLIDNIQRVGKVFYRKEKSANLI